jgi:LysR family transcriptional regulator, hca operon transcriptional activator
MLSAISWRRSTRRRRRVLELRHLRYFIAVAEESTLVAAAKRLRVAQPALTRQIHDLEREVGVELFERGARGVELTAAGEVCLRSART